MPLPLEELRQVLCDDWGVLSPKQWAELSARFSKPGELIDHLGRIVRFRRTPGNLFYVTPLMRVALESRQGIDDLVVEIGSNRWLKLQRIAEGGQGQLWIACPCEAATTADQLVALKKPILAKPGSEANRSLQHLQSEIDILRRVSSAYIAGLVDSDRASGTLATRLADGVSLEHKLQRERRLSVVQTVQIGIDVCRALEALHAAGRIHKDIKPGNIILERGKRAVLIDFGLAIEPSRAISGVEGTPYYIAPEIFNSALLPDARADVYSLAATLYRLLAGRPPHFHQCLNPKRFRSSGAQLDMLMFERADAALDCDLEDLRCDVPRQLSQLLCRALHSNRSMRPESADAFRVALESILAKFSEAARIEQELWGLADVLLEVFRAVHRDTDYAGKERKNANQIRRDIEQAMPKFPGVMGLRGTIDSWTEFASLYAVIPRTTKILARVEGLRRQLDEFLNTARPTDPNKQDRWTELLKDLVMRTLEGIRVASFDAVAAAHDWRTVLLQLGLPGSR